MLKKAMKENGYNSLQINEFLQDTQEIMEEQHDYMISHLNNIWGEWDGWWSQSHDILEDENITGEELEKIKAAYDDMGIEVSKAKNVEVKLTVSRSDNTVMSTTINIRVIKVGFSWYIDIMNMQDILQE
ncbi:hypothetical protein [Lachnoclostridium sp. An169]|uniref:hypothetical protein n=1 Tax=Lachnoclostridium sp. An169 TaxID=1965569 RepID=UPI00112450A5|nr:hypothetical protein [Lachnoclostridium sp. An169]